MEASLLQTYGFDLASGFDGVGVRRLWMMVEGLPESAPVWREESWTLADELRAQSMELSDAWSRRFYRMLSGKKVPGKGLHVTRPWEKGGEGRPLPQRQDGDGNRVTKLGGGELKKLADFFKRSSGG